MASNPGSTTSSSDADVSSGPKSPSEPAKIIGLYGVPGVGKSLLLKKLGELLDPEHFLLFEGSEEVGRYVTGGLEQFKSLDEPRKNHWRRVAIKNIKEKCAKTGKTGIVTGHFMFWEEGQQEGVSVWTLRDERYFTHILYLEMDASSILLQRTADTDRERDFVSSRHITDWQELEKAELRRICYRNSIFFCVATSRPGQVDIGVDKVKRLVEKFRTDSETSNQERANKWLDGVVASNNSLLHTMLVFDADRTLAPDDTGKMFWAKLREAKPHLFKAKENPLSAIFGGKLGYSYAAFYQTKLLYEEIDGEEYEGICSQIAREVHMYPELTNLIRTATQEEHIGAVILTSGIKRVWEQIIKKEGLSELVKIVVKGPQEEHVVSADVKAALVERMRDHHGLNVWAFGDCPLDVPMLRKANRAVVVVGEEGTRSRTMDVFLNDVKEEALDAQQLLLPGTVSPRRSAGSLLPVRVWEKEFMDSLTKPRMPIVHVTNTGAAKLLMTPMRNADNAGPALRAAHRRTAYYLAVELLPNVLELEPFAIRHVQGQGTVGHRLSGERKTLIVALMRGGEPMAIGVNDAFPLAMFIHAKVPEDLQTKHLQGISAVILVDAVVNDGTTVMAFVDHIQKLEPSVRIAVVAGVVQSRSVRTGGAIRKLALGPNFSLVTLRISENRYEGKGSTDTGHRLFNTTHLDGT